MNRKRAVTALTVYAFFRGLSIGFYQAFFGYYMKDIGYRMSEIGGVASAGGLVSFFLLPAIGSLIDYYSSWMTIIIAGILGTTALGVLGLSGSLKAFILSYTLYTLAFFADQPARYSYLARTVPQATLGFYVSLLSFSFSVASIIGSITGGLAIRSKGYRFSFMLYSSFWALGLALFTLIAPKIKEGAGRLPTSKEIKSRYRSLLRLPKDLRMLVLAASIDRTGWSLWRPLMAAHLRNFGYHKEEVGLVFGVFRLSQTSTSLGWGRATDIVGTSRVLFIAELLGALGALMLSRPQNSCLIYISVTLLGLSLAAWIPSYNKYVAESVSEERYGEAYSTANAYRSLVGVPAPLLGGYIYDYLGITPLFGISALLMITAGFLFLNARRAKPFK
jgi:MFS family permease